mmetsp:Transcript_35430/g.65621  ORF Transcript_35430/g.65621 Transcript_35430/m.65621 type:complete len:170 (+) Transcript_35430:300-809(+)
MLPPAPKEPSRPPREHPSLNDILSKLDPKKDRDDLLKILLELTGNHCMSAHKVLWLPAGSSVICTCADEQFHNLSTMSLLKLLPIARQCLYAPNTMKCNAALILLDETAQKHGLKFILNADPHFCSMTASMLDEFVLPNFVEREGLGLTAEDVHALVSIFQMKGDPRAP